MLITTSKRLSIMLNEAVTINDRLHGNTFKILSTVILLVIPNINSASLFEKTLTDPLSLTTRTLSVPLTVLTLFSVRENIPSLTIDTPYENQRILATPPSGSLPDIKNEKILASGSASFIVTGQQPVPFAGTSCQVFWTEFSTSPSWQCFNSQQKPAVLLSPEKSTYLSLPVPAELELHLLDTESNNHQSSNPWSSYLSILKKQRESEQSITSQANKRKKIGQIKLTKVSQLLDSKESSDEQFDEISDQFKKQSYAVHLQRHEAVSEDDIHLMDEIIESLKEGASASTWVLHHELPLLHDTKLLVSNQPNSIYVPGINSLPGDTQSNSGGGRGAATDTTTYQTDSTQPAAIGSEPISNQGQKKQPHTSPKANENQNTASAAVNRQPEHSSSQGVLQQPQEKKMPYDEFIAHLKPRTLLNSHFQNTFNGQAANNMTGNVKPEEYVKEFPLSHKGTLLGMLQFYAVKDGKQQYLAMFN